MQLKSDLSLFPSSRCDWEAMTSRSFDPSLETNPDQKHIPQLLEPSVDLCDQKHISYVNVFCPKSKCSKHLKKSNIKNYSKIIAVFSGLLMINKASWTWRNLWDSLIVSQTKVTSNPETPWSKTHKHTIVYTSIWILLNTYDISWALALVSFSVITSERWETQASPETRKRKNIIPVKYCKVNA